MLPVVAHSWGTTNLETAKPPATPPPSDFATNGAPAHAVDPEATRNSSGDVVDSEQPLYSTGKYIIDDALSSLSKATGSGKIMDNWLQPVHKVLRGLEGLVRAQPFPFIALGVSLFSGVIELEMDRRQNPLKARALVLQMADMMSALLQLHYVQDPHITTGSGESVQGRIQAVMRDVERDIKLCGNLINKHHQHSRFTRWFRSSDYADMFADAANNLANRKGEIKFACTVHVTITVDEVRKEVHDTNAMLRRVLAIFEHRSAEEKELDQLVEQHGGHERVRDNPEVALQVHAQLGRRIMNAALTHGKHGDSKATPHTKSSTVPKDEPTFDRKELLELQRPLSTVVADSLPYYENKLLAQIDFIKDEISKSTQQILSRIEAGSHDKVTHPDVRYVWKDMGWRSSVEARVFVLVLHDYYMDRYSLAAAKSQARNPSMMMISRASLSTPTETSSPAQGAASPGETAEGTSDAVILADKPFFDYLTMPYVASIAEAFDDDASGFVRISEVNEFCESIPSNWSLLKWIAYWARGWLVESSYYSHAIGSLLYSMEQGLGDSLAENHNIIFDYLTHESWTKVVRALAWCAASRTPPRTSTALDDLIKTSMLKKEERLERSLSRFNFLLDTPEALRLVIDSGRVEKDIFALLFVILRRHMRLVALAREKVIDEREFLDAQNTLSHIAHAIRQRVEQLQGIVKQLPSELASGLILAICLLANFKHQGFDINAEMGRFAGGVYEFLHHGCIPDGSEDPHIPADDWEAFWSRVLPKDLDLKQFRNFVNPDMWFDEPGSGPPPTVTIKEPVLTPFNETSTPGYPALHQSRSASMGRYRTPLVMPHSYEFLAIVSEHRNNLSAIKQEVTAFILQLGEQLRAQRHAAPVLRVLAQAHELDRATLVGDVQDPIRTRLFVKIVRIACAFAKLPDLDRMPASQFHGGYISRLHKISEQMFIDISIVLRVIKRSPASNEPSEGQAKPSETPDVNLDQTELYAAVDRMSRHAPMIAATIDVHISSGINRFRAAARTVLIDVHDRHYRRTWAFFKRHETLRKRFVAAYATKMRMDQAKEFWGVAMSGSKEVEEQYILLSREVSSAARPLWTALARLEHRKTIIHIACRCDHCEDVIVGPRYTCLYCEDIDLCHPCAQLKLRAFRDRSRRLHHTWHPLLRIARPVIAVPGDARPQFKLLLQRVQDSHSNEHDHFDSSDDVDDYYTVETDAQPDSTTDIRTTYKFKCSSCRNVKEGTRFFILGHQNVLQICSECEVVATTLPDNRPLPLQYRLLLRASLPLPHDDDVSSIASSEDDDELKHLRKKVALILEQQGAQEHRLNELMRGIESKVEGVAFALDRPVAQAHRLDDQTGDKMDSVVLAMDQQVAQGRRLSDRMHDLEAKMGGLDAKLDLVLNLLVALHDHSPVSPLRQLPNRPPGSRGKGARNDQSLDV